MFLLIVGETPPTPPPPHPPPPVPPRRRKKKISNRGTPKDDEKQDQIEVKICEKRIDRKRLPPPPPPSQIPRKNKTRQQIVVDKNQIQTRIVIHEPSPKIVHRNEQNEIVSLDQSSNSEDNIFKTKIESSKNELKLDEKLDRKELTIEMNSENDFNVDEVSKKEELKVDVRPKRKFKVHDSPERESNVNESFKNDFKADEWLGSELKVGESPLKKEFKVPESPKVNLKIDENPKNDKPFVTSPRYGELVKKQEFNKYPSLFFTLDDLESVITSNSPIDENKLKEELRIEENAIRNFFGSEEPNLEYEVTNDDYSFIDNNIIKDDNEICFRVTPTNFPFEKCLERWKTTSLEDNPEFDIDEKNHFIFEDYIDRSNRLNVRRSRSSMCYDIIETDGNNVIKEHTATKVRFVIEPPSSSTPDDCDSLPNVDFISKKDVFEQSINNLKENLDVEICEDNEKNDKNSGADLFGDVPFGSLLQNNVDEKSEIIHSIDDDDDDNVKENLEYENKLEQDEDKFINELSYNTSSLTSENSFPKEEETTTVDEFEMERNLSRKLSGELESFENNNTTITTNNTNTSTTDANTNNNNNNNNENVDYICENNRNTVNILDDLNDKLYSPKRSNTNERKKIFVTQTVRSFMNDDSLIWDESDDNDEEEFIDRNSLKFEIVKGEDTRMDSSVARIEKELKVGESILSVANFDESIDKIVDDSMSKEDCSNVSGGDSSSSSVPVSVRRNSFLETMLSDGENQSNWNTTVQGYCEIVAIHPKNDSSLISIEETNEKDSNLHKEPNKNKNQEKEEDNKNENSLNDKRKDIVDVKSNVLSELLSNFPTIKLRSVVEDEKEDSMNLNNTEFVLKNDEKYKSKKVREDKEEVVITKKIKNDIADEEEVKKKIIANQMAVQRIQEEIKETRQLDKLMKKSNSREIIPFEFDFNLMHLRNKNDGSMVIENVEEDHSVDDDELINDCLEVTRRYDDEEDDADDYDDDDDDVDYNKKINDIEDRVDKCAIVREKTPVVITRRNNDDNNRAITTPVDLSNDQSLIDHYETLTITPGSVRNFVKYYEIRQETTAFEDSKINDRKTLVRSKDVSSNVSNKIRNFEFKEQSKTARPDYFNSEKEKGKINGNNNNDDDYDDYDDDDYDDYDDDDCKETTGFGSLTNEISYTMIVKKKIVEPNEIKMECTDSSLGSTNGFDEKKKKKKEKEEEEEEEKEGSIKIQRSAEDGLPEKFRY
ncbi:hypothetical protein M0802_016182 [Mischocyttarus mexicanus]|nr:hypothetical protein M0802_016182 [Mischocyttarus mexicanus]